MAETLEKLVQNRDTNKSILDNIDGMKAKDKNRITSRRRLEAWCGWNNALIKMSFHYQIKDPVNFKLQKKSNDQHTLF